MKRLLEKQFDNFKNSIPGKSVLEMPADKQDQIFKVKTAFANGANVAICTVVISFIESMSKDEKTAIYEYLKEELKL